MKQIANSYFGKVSFAGIQGSSVIANGIESIAIHIEFVICHRLAIVSLQGGLD
jgi:hypothetical protein